MVERIRKVLLEKSQMTKEEFDFKLKKLKREDFQQLIAEIEKNRKVNTKFFFRLVKAYTRISSMSAKVIRITKENDYGKCHEDLEE